MKKSELNYTSLKSPITFIINRNNIELESKLFKDANNLTEDEQNLVATISPYIVLNVETNNLRSRDKIIFYGFIHRGNFNCSYRDIIGIRSKIIKAKKIIFKSKGRQLW